MKESLDTLLQRLGEAKAWADRIMDPIFLAIGGNGTLYLLAAEMYHRIPERNIEGRAGVGLTATAAMVVFNYYVLPPLVRRVNAATRRAEQEGQGLSLPSILKTASLGLLTAVSIGGGIRALETGGTFRPSSYVIKEEAPEPAERIYTTLDYTNPRLQDMMARGVFEEGFLDDVERMCARQDMHAMALLSVMHYETGGTFSPRARNPFSNATGLIQFIPQTAQWLGTTTRVLGRMTQRQQLAYVERYFQARRTEGADLSNPHVVATAVFYPLANGILDYVIARRGSRTYRQNRGGDLNRDGILHAEEYIRNALGNGYLNY